MGDITNSETISGKAILKTKEGYIRKDSKAFGGNLAMSHQWRTINATSTGNGISNLAYISTVDRYTYSEDKVNGSYIKSVKNSGIISGNVDATTGSGATQTTIRASVTGNGISSAAYSNNFVKSLTEATIDKIQNNGTISGRLKAEVGNNTARGFHEYSNAIITGSANGVSVYSRSSNGQMKNSRAVIGELTNSGSISGNLYAKAGSGYGEVKSDVKSSGNGVAIYTESSTKKETKIGSIDNKGMITGKAVIYGGKDKKAMENKTLRDKIFHVPLTNKIAEYSLPDEDVEADKKAVAEMKKYEEEMANELENKIEKYKKQIVDKEKDILAKTPKKPEISEADKKDRDNTFEKYLKAEIRFQQDLILSGYNEKVVAEARKRKAELEKLKGSATDDEKIKFLGEYKAELEKRINGLQAWQKKEINEKLAKINNILEKNKGKDIPDTPEILALKKEKAELEKELAKVIDEKKKSDHLAANVHTETGVVASGNGISINDGKEDGVVLGSLKNSGVISGETEIHHGNSQRKYSRIAHKNSGAGIAVGGNVEGKIENTGIISGTEFALLAKGKRSDAYGIDKENVTYESGFKGGVDNYGILAGRIIIGGYQSAHTGSHGKWGKIEEEYGYFETIYKDKKHYNNKGIFLVLDRNGEVRKVIGEDKETVHNGRTVKNVLDKDGTYEGDTTNKIINGVGKDGVVIAKEKQNKNIENSIINGFKNAIKVKKNGLVKISNSTINANGFGKSYAILGDEGANEVEITNKSIINGKIHLGAGDDRLTLSGNYRLNREVDLGTGNNTLAFGKKENTTRRTLSYSTFGTSSANTSVFNGTVNNANKVEVNENTAFSSNSRINGVNELNLANGKTLDYYFVDKENQAFAELAKSNRNLKVNGSGKVNLVPIGSKVQIGYEKDLLGFSFGNNLLKPNSNGGTTPPNNGRVTSPNNNPGNNTPGNRGGFFIDPRLTPFDRYSKGAFDAYIADYKSTGIDFLKDYKSTQEVFKNYLYNLTNNNPVGYLKDSAIDTVLAYHKTNANSNFAKKGQTTVSGETFNIRNKYYENNKVVSNGASAEISYGTSDNTNIGLNIGGGQSKVKTSNENIKSEVLVLGVNAEYKVKNFSWKNEVSYGRIKPKKYSALDTYSLYSQLGYNIPLSETWTLTPKVSVFLSKVKQKEMTVNNIKVAKDDDTFVETTVGTELNKKFMFGNNGINFGLGVDYSMVKDLDDSKAHFVGGSTEFDLRNYDRKNRATAEIKFGYEHISGVTATFRIRKNKDITSSGFGLGYKF